MAIEQPTESLLHDGFLKQNIALIKKRYLNRHYDWVNVIDGFEGTGKSTFAIQICQEIDPSFNLTRVCFTPRQYLSAVENARKRTAILYDEAGTGLFSREAMSATSIILNKVMMTVRSKSLFHCIVLPNFFKLDQNIRENRTASFLHVYNRGKFAFYSRKRLRIISVKGYYAAQRPNFYGTFSKVNPYKRQYEIFKQRYLKNFFATQGLADEVGPRKLNQIIRDVKKNWKLYAKDWRGSIVVDRSLVMHDFELGRGNADKVKKIVQRMLNLNRP